MPNNNIPQILIQPLKPALISGVAQKLPVLIRIQAPDAVETEKKARKPYHLALVIDRSGSMSGPPLAEAVRCAKHITDQLQTTDTASLVIFDDRVQTLVPAPGQLVTVRRFTWRYRRYIAGARPTCTAAGK